MGSLFPPPGSATMVQGYTPISTPYELVTMLQLLNSNSSKSRRTKRVSVTICYYGNQRISSSQETKAPLLHLFALIDGATSSSSSLSYEDSVVSLLDYGAGNVRSIRNAIHHLGYQINEVKCAADIKNAKHLIFPGVGAFGTAIDSIRKQGLADALCDYILQDKHFLGICLGLQLLFESSEEKGNVQGLGIIPGIVRKFDSSEMVKVPHIGWNQLNIKRPSKLLKQVHGQHVYFVHSYRALASPANRDWQLATCNHGGEFIAAVKKGNVHAVQFHPEKSGVVGMGILQQFLEGDQSAIEEVEEESIQSYGSTSRLAKRVIACLDVRSNEKGDLVVTKGDQYDVRDKSDNREVRNLGKPVELASRYYEEGADEVAFLNITGFRDFPLADIPMLEVLQRTSGEVFVPLTVGGGIRDFKDKDGRQYSSLEVAAEYFRSGADKISIGSDAVYAAEEYLKTGVKSGRSSLEQISCVYGNQAVVVSIDPRRVYVSGSEEVPFKTIKVNDLGPNGEEYVWYQCTVNGGREGRPIGAYELAQAVEELGAGEILLNCIDCDGQGHGFDLELVNLISDAVGIPVIASSGAGSEKHFSEVFLSTAASAALAAGIFHRQEVKIGDVKEHLRAEGIEVRCCTKEYATVSA